ncbi:MAG: hypothetical protein ACREEQ_04480, partial [Caulobacteraceae bacterium]
MPTPELMAPGRTPTWTDPGLTAIGRLPARASLHPFPDAASALAGDPARSPFVHMLSGDWRFRLAASPADIEADFTRPSFDDSRWAALPVPSNWTMHGFDRPHYTNVQ